MNIGTELVGEGCMLRDTKNDFRHPPPPHPHGTLKTLPRSFCLLERHAPQHSPQHPAYNPPVTIPQTLPHLLRSLERHAP